MHRTQAENVMIEREREREMSKNLTGIFSELTPMKNMRSNAATKLPFRFHLTFSINYSLMNEGLKTTTCIPNVNRTLFKHSNLESFIIYFQKQKMVSQGGK